MYFCLYPEVAGGFGENVEYDPITNQVGHLHYEFDGWLGDDLLQTSPCCYIVSDRLRLALVKIPYSGHAFADVEISTSELFRELYPSRELPHFSWLKVFGEAAKDDFGVSADKKLVVSARVLEAIRQNGRCENCDVTEYM